MRPWLSIVLPIVLLVLNVVAVAVVNTKIKFAPSPEAATQELKQLALRVVPWILYLISAGFLVYSLFWTVTSSEPLTRGSVFSIALGVAALLFIVVMYFINRILKIILVINEMIGKEGYASELRMSLHKVSDHKIVEDELSPPTPS